MGKGSVEQIVGGKKVVNRKPIGIRKIGGNDRRNNQSEKCDEWDSKGIRNRERQTIRYRRFQANIGLILKLHRLGLLVLLLALLLALLLGGIDLLPILICRSSKCTRTEK